MFEKEAEELIQKNIKLNKTPRETVYEAVEFGYNKAKEEWKKHFMQCSSPFCLDIFSSVKCYGELGNMAKKEGEEK